MVSGSYIVWLSAWQLKGRCQFSVAIVAVTAGCSPCRDGNGPVAAWGTCARGAAGPVELRDEPTWARRPGYSLFLFLFVLLIFIRALRRLDVDRALGDRAELLVGPLLFVQRLGEQIGGFLVAQQLRERHRRAVAGDLVVLDLLEAHDQTRIEHLGFGVLFEQ